MVVFGLVINTLLISNAQRNNVAQEVNSLYNVQITNKTQFN